VYEAGETIAVAAYECLRENMSLTKDEISDLRSYIDLIEQRGKEFQLAEWALKEAKRVLEQFLSHQLYSEKK
jgi:hypothetical protein